MLQHEKEITFKGLFLPFTTKKAVFWILLTGLVVYFNSLFNGFVGDDSAQILDNTLVHSITNLPVFFTGSTLHIKQLDTTVGLYYRPILSIVFSLIYSFFGPNAFFFHAVQLILHIGVAILIFLILKKHFRTVPSFVLSLLFLLHPINNEAVVYISNLQEELFAFFGFLSFYFLTKGKSLFLVGGLLLLSLLSKESAIIFVPILLLYAFLFREDIKQRMDHLLLSLAIIIALYLGLRIFVGNIGLQTRFLYMSENASLIQRLFTMPAIIFYYLRMIFFPLVISFGWYFVVKQLSILNFWIPLIIDTIFSLIIVIPLLTMHAQKISWKLYAFFILTFLFSIAIVLQVIPLDLTVADRWFYLPLFGLIGIVGVMWDFLTKKLSKTSSRVGLLVIVIGLLLFFSLRDVVRNSDWKDSFTLCKNDALINRQSYVLEYCLGNEYKNRNEYSLAELHEKKAIDLYPQYFLSWYTLGSIYAKEGDKDKAESAFRKTLALNTFGQGSGELAILLVYDNKPQQSKEVAEKYLKIIPNSAQLWYALSLANYQLGNQDDAINAAQKAYMLAPTPLTEKVYKGLRQHIPIKL